MPTGQYVLVTPVHNEAPHLDRVIRSVEGQSVKPVLWVTVDDASTDESNVILDEAAKRIEWLHVVHLDDAEYARDVRYSAVCRAGFARAKELILNNGLSCTHVALLDSDIIAPPDYFETLIHRMEMNPRVAIASGQVASWEDGKLQRVASRRDWPCGAARVWSFAAFYATGGYDLTPAPDSVANVHAISRGFTLAVEDDLCVTQVRPTGAASGLLRGYQATGYSAYYLGSHPLLILLRGARTCLDYPYYTGLFFVLGFARAALQRQPQTSDVEVRTYYWHQRLREVFRSLGGLIGRT